MATTASFEPSNSAYTEVVAGTTNDFLLQNVGWTRGAIVVVFAASLPAAGAVGHALQPGEAVVRNGLTGKVYAKSLSANSGLVMVTEE